MTRPSEAALAAAEEFLYEESDRGWLSAELEHKQLNAARIRVALMLDRAIDKAVAAERAECLAIVEQRAETSRQYAEDFKSKAAATEWNILSDVAHVVRARGAQGGTTT